MLAECERDCYGTQDTGLFIRGQSYDIDPHAPWAIHFKLPPKERLIALTEHRKRVEAARERKDRLAALRSQGKEPDQFTAELAALSEQKEKTDEGEKFVCDCGFEAASRAGLGAHKRGAHPEVVA